MIKFLNKELIIKPINIFLIFLALVAILSFIVLWFLYQDVNVIKNQTYDIWPGATSREIAYDLAQKKIIKHPLVFNWYVKLKNFDKKLQAGRYDFPEDNKMSLKELIEFLASNARAREVEVTIPEGYTVELIANLLVKKGLAEKDDFLQTIEQKFSIFNFQFSNNKQFSIFNLEGFLFPDTYRIYENTEAREIIAKMLANFERKITPDLLLESQNQNHNLSEVIIIASILEREVQTEEDMRQVADILWRRLDADMALEVDSTLNYILTDDNRRASLTFEQLQIDSPYNTYKYKGLPPRPICNPGLKAIRAAIYPIPNDYWFYLSKPNSETVFTKTFKEQVENKKKYLK